MRAQLRASGRVTDCGIESQVGGGGWRAKGDGAGGGYVIAVYSTKNIESSLGQLQTGAYPIGIAFHPTLNLGVSVRGGAMNAELSIFNSKSLTAKQTMSLPSHSSALGILGFAGKGTKVICSLRTGSLLDSAQTLYLAPFNATPDDQATLNRTLSK